MPAFVFTKVQGLGFLAVMTNVVLHSRTYVSL